MGQTNLTGTWERYVVLSHVISLLSIKDRRHIFGTIKDMNQNEITDYFFPNHGFTLSEFAVFHFISDNRKRTLIRKKIVDPTCVF